MKTKTILTFILINILINVNAQNLVPNWSFEDTVACPPGIQLANGWDTWRNTPDYFHTCSSDPFGSVPQNFMGYQNPKTGNAYAGFYTYTKNGTNIREIIGSQLSQQLMIGFKYFISFYVSNARNVNNSINGANNKIGMKFSTIPFSFSNPVPIDNFAHVYTDSIISDSLIWVKISGSFIADSAYTFVGIGNFFTDTACSQIFFDSISAFIYYYIDDIKISTDSNFVNGFENNYEADIIQIYPNLARDWIVVEGRNIKSIEAYDLCGRLILPKMSVSSFRTVVNISTLRHGMYLIKVNSNNSSFIQKFVKH